MTATYGNSLYGSGLYSAVDDAVSNRITAWAFVLDGHLFYVLNLGIQGTLVCDISNNNQWYEWAYFGSVGFPCKEGCDIEDLYLIGDKLSGQIYNLDPNEFMDDEKFIETYTTGVYPVRGNDTVPCYEFVVDGTISGVELTGAILFTSDDFGETWQDNGYITAEFPLTDMAWRSLGQMNAPGRIFQVYDTGAFSQINTFFIGT